MKYISSAQNPQIKELKGLQEKVRKRAEKNQFVIEGLKELDYAIESGYQIEQIYVTKTKLSKNTKKLVELMQNKNIQIFELSDSLFESLCYRSTSEIIGVSQKKKHKLEDLNLKENPLILISETPEKPGNIGALARTVDAGRIDALIIIDPKTDLYNPNVIRSSVGCIFAIPIAISDQDEVFSFLESKKIKIYSATFSQKAKSYAAEKYTKPSAIAVGSEDKGLTKSWLERSENHIFIPMQGLNDSLNLSVAAGILLFEAVRQRNIE
tara:strand:- start:448 stop:1248 length:801 start_codon:yes stop_codon:yes gene_type:complete